jgi:hypothetical protein
VFHSCEAPYPLCVNSGGYPAKEKPLFGQQCSAGNVKGGRSSRRVKKEKPRTWLNGAFPKALIFLKHTHVRISS